MGDPGTRVTHSDGRTWDVPNLWFCDGSLMPTGRVAPSITIMANSAQIADRIVGLARRGDLARPACVTESA